MFKKVSIYIYIYILYLHSMPYPTRVLRPLYLRLDTFGKKVKTEKVQSTFTYIYSPTLHK